MSTAATPTRHRKTPAILSLGLRPLFLLAAIWAALAMIGWVAILSGRLNLPTRFDPVTWHAHEFLFGYLGAVIAGFLLTAIPNWTGRPPLCGLQLGGLVGLWVLGRLAVLLSALLPLWTSISVDVAFLIVLWGISAREIAAGRNWRNLPVLGLVGVFICANLMFHVESAKGLYAVQGYGLRLGISAALVLIMVIGGKIIPSFTRNWLVKQGDAQLPTPPMQRFDKVAILATIAVLFMWVLYPTATLTGLGLIVMSGLNTARLVRWAGRSTAAEPLVLVLHVAFAFLPLGALFNGVAILVPDAVSQAGAIHVWTAGAIGLMTIAVMTRASLGHCGRPLKAGWATTLIYLALIVSVLIRVLADYTAGGRMGLLEASAVLWIACFAGFAVVYGPLLVRARHDSEV